MDIRKFDKGDFVDAVIFGLLCLWACSTFNI